MTARIGFIGAGRMAEAMMRGLVQRDVYSPEEIIACAPSEKTRDRISEELGISMYVSASEIAEMTDTLVLAVKPKQVPAVFEDEGLKLTSDHLLISIAAGVTTSMLGTYVPDAHIIRVMPNHCCMVLEGAAAYSLGRNVTDEDIDTVEEILSATGLAVEVREEDLDAVTGVSGSSPAFAYMFIRAIAKAGTMNGLPIDISMELAAQSMIGAGMMVLETGLSPEELIDNVCSPGGTTVEGIRVLKDMDLESIVTKAVEASINRSREMSRS